MALGLAAINSMIPSVDYNLIADKLAERMSPGLEKAAQGAMAVLFQPEMLKTILRDSGTSVPE